MMVPVTVERPLRRDAERNRERIVAAARSAFAEYGLDAPMEDVARRAGVGVGTVYRRFPAKEDLIDAVFEDTLDEVAGIAREAARHSDAWLGFCFFVEQTMALNAANRGLKDVIGARAHGRARLEACRERLRPLIGELVTRAQEQGSLRTDFSATDLPILFASAGRVMEVSKEIAPELWRRFVGLLLDGLRSDAATPLPVPPLTRGQLRRVGFPSQAGEAR